MDSELVQQAQIFSTKFESFMKGKETYEDIKVKYSQVSFFVGS